VPRREPVADAADVLGEQHAAELGQRSGSAGSSRARRATSLSRMSSPKTRTFRPYAAD